MTINSADAFRAYVKSIDDQKFNMPTEMPCNNCGRLSPVAHVTHDELRIYCAPCNYGTIYSKRYVFEQQRYNKEKEAKKELQQLRSS